MLLATGVMCVLSAGCMSRFIHEGVGTARGASGKVVESGSAQKLAEYKSLTVESVTVARSLSNLDRVAGMIRTHFESVAQKRGLSGSESPGLRLSGEITHHESADAVDTVTGPLEEVIVAATLTDAQSGQIVAQANLIGRAKATTASGDENLADGVRKALEEWLDKHSVRKSAK
jgi:hypothetical protein